MIYRKSINNNNNNNNNNNSNNKEKAVYYETSAEARLLEEIELETWMQDVVHLEKLDERVFHLAKDYLNRFLELTSVNRNQLQLVASACLLLSSKVGSGGLKSRQLLEYTDNNIQLNQLLDMEMVVLSNLCWDLHFEPQINLTSNLMQAFNLQSSVI